MKNVYKSILIVAPIVGALIGCNSSSSSSSEELNVTNIDFKLTTTVNNRSAYVTSQCYTKTTDSQNIVHNPCFTCHINSDAPNYIDDADLQESLDFGEYTKTNRFTNLFRDRTEDVAKISDGEILEYVRENNYKADNRLLLKEKLTNSFPSDWDVNENGVWDGYTPDCYFNFDSEGFDKDNKGDYTGWRAFAYYPFLGTFWPTNGSTDDVLMRLPEEFRKDSSGNVDLNVYKINLAIIESLIKESNITIAEVDENLYGVDLNQDGTLGTSNSIVFNWEKPTYDQGTNLISNFSMSYVGLAKDMLTTNEHLIAPGLYPKGTEFLHSVRYIDLDENDSTIKMATRMKELRYAKKDSWNNYSQLENAALAEIKEKDAFPDRLRTIVGNSEDGLQTGLGWTYQGFIEDINGDLRPQNYEETQYCIGCHSGIGAIKDSTFVFQRKFEDNATDSGWYHWSQDSNGLKNILEPKTRDGRYEYSLYLEANSAGDEFRGNSEVMEKFFETNGSLKTSEIEVLRNDISHLLYPSVERALELNKAYKVIVDEQSFIYGRDAHIKPVENVHKEVTIGEATNIEKIEYK